MAKRTLLSWSSGKDSAWALHLLRQDPAVDVAGLFTVVTERQGRAAMHATRMELLHCQANAAGLPLRTLALPDPCPEARSEEVMGRFIGECVAEGVECIAFGDLFLEEIRRYREAQLRGSGIEPLFPLWGMPTGELAETMLGAGLEAYVSSVDLGRLPLGVCGRRWTRKLIAGLPPGSDACGENGETHTIVTGGPMFRHAIPVRVGEVVARDGFAHADIIPIA